MSFRYHLSDDDQRGGEAQPARWQLDRSRRIRHDGPDHVVGHQKPVGFLDDAHGALGAQGLLGRALVGLDLIDGELELPTGVVGDDDLPSGGEIRVQQRGDQAMFYPMAGRSGSSRV